MRYKMLIVEDNLVTLEILSSMFEDLGFDVTAIDDGGKVLTSLEATPADIIILDLGLPNLTGDQIYISIKNNPKLKGIPIIPFTAHDESNVPGSMPSILTAAAWDKTKDNPHIVFKPSNTNQMKDVKNQLIAEVLTGLTESGKPPTYELAQWYAKQRNINPVDVN